MDHVQLEREDDEGGGALALTCASLSTNMIMSGCGYEAVALLTCVVIETCLPEASPLHSYSPAST